MTLSEAYDFTLSKIEELKNLGIGVIIVPATKSQNNKKTIEKYNTPNNISPDKWIHVTLVANKKQAEKIYNMKKYLCLCGITFDSGGSCGSRDWELDWSFRYNPLESNEDHNDALEELEILINKIEEEYE